MPISALPTPPSRSDSPQDFSDRADALLGALPGFVTEANALQSDVNAKEASASSHATIATNKAAEAQAYANTASTKASEAAAYAVAAAAAASNAEIAFDSFDDKYLGSKASDPTTDNDGNALLVGALYWNTSVGAVRVWNGAAWLSMAADASIVDFQQAGAGAVVRTAQDKMREWVSVKDFGAVGDGVADDTLAVQSAFNAVPNGGTVIVDGLFKISSTVTVSKSMKLLGGSFGYGSLRTGFINTTDTTLKMFAIRAHYVSFEKLLISGAGKAGTSVAIEVGDGVSNYDKFSFSNDAGIVNFRYGIVLRSQNCAVRGGATLSTCGTGVQLAGVPGANNNRNIYFNEANFHSCDVGIETAASYYAVGITGCDFNSCLVDAIKGTFYSSSIVGNNFIYSGEDDIDITSASVGGVLIVGNTMSGVTGMPAQGTGIKISGDYCNVVGNFLSGRPGDGINVSGVGNSILSNSVVNSNYFNAAGFSNIKVAGNINRVIGNVSRTTTGGTSMSEYGIHVVSGVFNIVALNRVDGNKIAQIKDDAASLVRLNQGFATDAKGSATIAAASTSVVVNHGLAAAPTSGSVQLTMANNSAATKIWVSGETATQFTINCDVAPGGSGLVVGWSVA